MARSVYLELDAEAMTYLREIMAAVGEVEPSAMVSRALGLVEAVTPFISKGVLTVVDPKEGNVELVFENMVEPENAEHAA